MSFDVNTWNQASEDGAFEQSEAPPDGMYEVLVTDFKAFESKAGKAIVVVELQAVGGQHAGHQWSIISGFASAGATGVTKSTCARLGVDVAAAAITQAPTPQAALEALDAAGKTAAVGQWFSVKVQRNGEFTNTYVDSKLAPKTDAPADTAGFQQPQPVAAGAGADKVPF